MDHETTALLARARSVVTALGPDAVPLVAKLTDALASCATMLDYERRRPGPLVSLPRAGCMVPVPDAEPAAHRGHSCGDFD